MDNNELNNEHIENPSSDLKDYEKEVSVKKNFFSSLLDRFKTNKNQKLLTNGKDSKTYTTNRSITSLWGIGNLRASLFTSLDSIRQAISKIFSSEYFRNSLTVEVIGESTTEQVEKIVNNDAVQETPIIPNVTPKNIPNNVYPVPDVKIGVIHIDTSAIFKKSGEITDKKSSVSTNESITPSQSSLDER